MRYRRTPTPRTVPGQSQYRNNTIISGPTPVTADRVPSVIHPPRQHVAEQIHRITAAHQIKIKCTHANPSYITSGYIGASLHHVEPSSRLEVHAGCRVAGSSTSGCRCRIPVTEERGVSTRVRDREGKRTREIKREIE
jgi:hypothetical protein